MTWLRRKFCEWFGHDMKPEAWRYSPFTVANFYRDWRCQRCGFKLASAEPGYADFSGGRRLDPDGQPFVDHTAGHVSPAEMKRRASLQSKDAP